MLIRIVRMTFKAEYIKDFEQIFDDSKAKIRAMNGCNRLELLRDLETTNVFMTYSYWDNATALENYRQSELFRSTWAKTKILFAEKPLAYSVERLIEL
jgi:quinol monooxygenase YgiN